MAEHPDELELEQKCLRSGLWRIEGYIVRRVRHGSIVRWLIKGWEGHPAGVEVRTLHEVREWIRDNR